MFENTALMKQLYLCSYIYKGVITNLVASRNTLCLALWLAVGYLFLSTPAMADKIDNRLEAMAIEGQEARNSEDAYDYFKKECAKQRTFWTKYAHQGKPAAQYLISICYGFGYYGKVQDHAEEIKWLQKAAAQNYAPAQLDLGDYYDHGVDGVLEKDKVKGFELVSKAAAQGNSHAQVSIGAAYEMGEYGVVEDKVKAAEWYCKAAAQGNGLAKSILSQSYRFPAPLDICKK